MVFLVPLEFNVWCYVVAGSLLLLTNLPIFLIIITTKQLRVTFGALATIFATGTLTGFTSVTKGFVRYAAVKAGNTQFNNLSAVYCLKKAFVILDLFTFPSSSVLSMVNSFDRLLVVSMPLFYFKKAKSIVITEIILAFLAILLLEAFTITAAVFEDRHMSSTFCRQAAFLPPYVYLANICFRLVTSVLAVLIMLVVLYVVKRRSINLIGAYGGSYRDHYIAKQNIYTKAMLLSCSFTLLLDTLPNVAVVIARLNDFENEDDYVSYSRILCMFNGVIMVVVILWYKTEIREILLEKFREIRATSCGLRAL